MHFLGLDIGTSAVKAVIVDERQTVVAQASVPIQTRRPRPGWFEQDPEEWWRATERAVAGALPALSRRRADAAQRPAGARRLRQSGICDLGGRPCSSG
ncbi:MAG: FGGY family carbohydrate kinase, partial [Bauldia sp.]|nr:FGGY family carbohydrate kinase [Bauldia sp.]